MAHKNNYFSVVSVDGYDFPTTPQVSYNFSSQGLAFLNRGSYTIEYSFDGQNVHGDLNPNDASAGIIFDGRDVSKIWFRASGGFGSVRVEAWY